MSGYKLWSVFGAALLLSSCASPYFVHDPQTGVVDREEVPRLLKSLRCEMATYVAVNNQRHMLYVAEATVRNYNSATEKYQYFELDPTRFGGIALDLRIQDTLGMLNGSEFGGTQFDWTRTSGTHTHIWDFGPTLSDQSTYEANWGFIVPQDTITLASKASPPAAPKPPVLDTTPLDCYSAIPKRNPPPFNDPLAVPDYDAVAHDPSDYALYKRVLVNNTIPLAAWLLDVSKSITDTTQHWHNARPDSNPIYPAQMIYTFTVQVTGGLDARYGLTSPLWPTVAVEGSAAMQKTNTITIWLNGAGAANFAIVPQGAAINDSAMQLPTIQVPVPPSGLPGAPRAAPRAPSGFATPRGHMEFPILLLRPSGPTR